MIAPIVLLDVVDAVRSWTFLRRLSNRRKTRSFLGFLVSLFSPRRSVLILLASLALVPRVLVDDTDFVAA